MLHPGRMDRVVTLKKRTVSGQDTYGEETLTWADVDIWAERRELRGDERFAAQQWMATLDARYFVYYREDITPKDRLVDTSKTYEIQAVIPLGRREGLELYVSRLEGQ